MSKDNLQEDQSSKQFASIQEKNLEHLIKVLGTKASIDALTEIGKVEKNTWKDIKETTKSLADLALGGGISSIKAEITTIVEENIYGALAPLYNEIQPLINEVMLAIQPLMPYITELVKWATDILVPIIQWIADMIEELIDFFSSDPGAIEDSPFYEGLVALGKIKPPTDAAGEAGVFTSPTTGGHRPGEFL